MAELAAVAQVVAAIVLVIGLILAARQLREAGRARRLQATRAILDEIGNEKIRQARQWVLDKMPEPHALDLSSLPEEDRWRALSVAVALDRVAYMVRQGLIPEDPLFNWQQDEIELLWKKLKPIVVQMQQKRPHYCAHFKWLAKTWLQDMERKTLEDSPSTTTLSADRTGKRNGTEGNQNL